MTSGVKREGLRALPILIPIEVAKFQFGHWLSSLLILKLLMYTIRHFMHYKFVFSLQPFSNNSLTYLSALIINRNLAFLIILTHLLLLLLVLLSGRDM